MWGDWWRRLFDTGDDDTTEERQTLFQAHDHSGQSSPSVGRFSDASRQVEVRMAAQYPKEGTTNVGPSSTGHRETLHTNLHDDEDHGSITPDRRNQLQHEKTELNKKPPFRLSKVPSPVFGFQKPPKNFYHADQHEDYYLDAQKEVQEKKQISEAKLGERIKKQLLIPSRKDGPVLEQKVMDEPALRRTREAEVTEHHSSREGDHSPYTEGVNTPSERNRPDDGSGSLRASEDIDSFRLTSAGARRNRLPEENAVPDHRSPEEQTERAMSVKSRLNRSPHRHGEQSKVPFNVLMFHSDHHRGHSSGYPAAQPAANQTVRPPAGGDGTGLKLPLDLLDDIPETAGDSASWIADREKVLKDTLSNFHVEADLIGYVQGPSVTRFDIHLHPGVKFNKVLGLSEDIKLSLAVRQIRIAPVPGKSAVGIEIPNEVRQPVLLRQILRSKAFLESRAPLTAALGQDVSGNQIVTDLAKMPHGLIAGATGSGKSVCIHSLILSLIYRTSPDDVRFLLIDPKVVELAPYQNIPHLAAPVITEPKEAALALKWAVEEMEKRYHQFAAERVRDIESFNKKQKDDARGHRLPYIVIIIDELADLMMVSPQDVEEAVCRIAQKARAAGIHLLLATQRPSVDVITGLIKSNIPTRIAFSVSSQTDSRTILDSGGAERLLGRGDMLFAENGARGLKRIQGCFVSDEEINRVTGAFGESINKNYLFSPDELSDLSAEASEMEDDLLDEAASFVIDQGQASVSSIQRHFRIGYNRAARLVEELESRNVISGANGSKPRQVLVTKEHMGKRMSDDT